MKKKGFTLAEVLITLAIIGVVASLTLPSLMSNTSEQQYKTALRKVVNTLSEAGQMNDALEGWAYSGLTTGVTTTAYNSSGNLYPSLYALLSTRTNFLDTKRSMDNKGDNDVVAYFKDGTAIMYKASDSFSTSGRPDGFLVTVDVNGAKGPNTYSNCVKKSAMASYSTSDAQHDDFNAFCNQKANRMIKDRFRIRLHDTLATPVDDAGRWAMEN